MPTLPKIREEADVEHHRAKWWRQKVVRLKATELAELTGYTEQVIYLMEHGVNSQGKRVATWVWQRYKMACAAAHARLYGWRQGEVFDWPDRLT